VLEGVPGIDYREGGVNFEAADFDRAMEGINRLVGVATLAWNQVVIESFTKGKPARDVFRMGIPPIISRWADVESGRWNPPPPPPAKPRRYHGSS